jgi:branched-chain amino acid transport system ATP-binding protein
VDDPLLSVHGLVKRYGGLVATDNLNLSIRKRELHAIIGPNGAGKTTLMNQLTGEIRPDAGKIVFAGQDVTRLPPNVRAAHGIGRSFQITHVFLDLTVLENVSLAVQARSGHSFRFWRKAANEAALLDPARVILAQVGLADRADELAVSLSHGEKRALELAIALAGSPKLLLLDEPMAGMGPEESMRMVQFLKTLKGKLTILLIEHDIESVFALADRITVLVYGRSIAQGTADDIRNHPEVKRAYLGEEDM